MKVPKVPKLPKASRKLLAPSPANPVDPATPRIVVFDDQPWFYTWLEDAFSSDFEVQVTSSREEALSWVQRAPAIVVSDICAGGPAATYPGADPSWTGLDFIAEVRRLHPDLQIVAYTGAGDSALLDALKDLRAEWVPKDNRQLRRILNRLR